MYSFKKIALNIGALALLAGVLCSATNDTSGAIKPDNSKPLVIRIVNFKSCVEKSKLGKQEQGSFEALKKQMESVLEEKEKALKEFAGKFNDPDYLDSLSPDAEAELKHKYRMLNQELSQQQTQYYQSLNQTNLKVLQNLNDIVAKAAAQIAKQDNIDLILNEESFYHAPYLDISDKVVAIMDENFQKDNKELKQADPKK